MKKSLLLLSCILFSLTAWSNDIVFADANVKALCVANWDTNGDGELSEAEAAAVTTLGEVFKDNTEITSFNELQYFTGVTALLGWTSFSGCSSLTSIIIPAGVTSIDGSSFANCSSLEQIVVDPNNTVYDSRSNCNAIIETETNTLVSGCWTTVIPDGVTTIGGSSFWGRWGMQAMAIPESVTSIGSSAFAFCISLNNVILPSHLSTIGQRAFEECNNLTSVTVKNPEPVAITENTFTNRANATLHVPFGSKAAYKAADYWKEFKEIIAETPEGNWVNLVANSDMEGDDVTCFFSKENAGDPQPSTFVDGAGYDGSRGIVIDSFDNPENTWDTQFFVRLPKPLPAGTNYRVSFNYKASQNAYVSTQMHTEPGGYIHWEGIGNMDFTTEWQTYEHMGVIDDDQSPNENMQTIAFNLSELGSATTYYFDNFIFEIDEDNITPPATVKTHPVGKTLNYTGEPQELVVAGISDEGTMVYQLNWGGFSEAIPVATDVGTYTIDYKVIGSKGYINSKTHTITAYILPAEMTDLVVNGDMEGDDVTCFFSKEAAGDVLPSTIVDGAGKDGTRCIVINSSDDPEHTWDTQFFVRLPKPLPAGTVYRVRFDYKASQGAYVSSQVHTEPGNYIHWEGIGNMNFTTEWNHYDYIGTISADQSPENNMQTIAFLLSESSSATTYYFDNFIFEVDSNNPVIDNGEQPKQLRINELMQSNIDCLMDDQKEFPDSWVELYNSGTTPVNLGRYKLGLTNDVATAWQLPWMKIEAGQFAVIYCDKVGMGLHTDFRLDSGKGGSVYLFFDGSVDDSRTKIAKQPAPNISLGYKNETDNMWGYQYEPTPKAPNCNMLCTTPLGNPVFSEKGRVFTAGTTLQLELTPPVGAPEGTVVRYTLDGSEPKTSSTAYTSPITINETTTVRAKAFCAGYLTARSVTQSYIFMNRDMTLPVISLVTDDSYWYDDELGILTNNSDGKSVDWRRPVNIEFFDAPDTPSKINQLGETRVQGGATRSNPLKSLAIYANKRFGTKRFTYEFFPDQRPGVTEFKSLILRNAGNDYYNLYMRDAVIQRTMAQHVDLDWQGWRPAIVFKNGVYKGMLSIRERSNEDNIYSHYKDSNGDGLENIDMIENWWDLKEGDWNNYDSFKAFYQETGHTMQEYEQWMDCGEFANLMLMNLYYSNRDFPGNNIVMWRPRTADGKWRWIAKDTDFGLGLYGHPANYNTIEWLYNHNYHNGSNNWANDPNATMLFRHLMDDTSFRKMFLDRAAVYMGDFLNERGTRAIWDPMVEMIQDEYPYHHQAGNGWRDWNSYNDELQSARQWLADRTAYFYQQLAEFYQLGTPTPLTVNKNLTDNELAGMTISMNDIRLSQPLFDGMFFAGSQVTLKSEGDQHPVKGWKIICLSDDNTQTEKIVAGAEYSFTMPVCQLLTINALFDDSEIPVNGDLNGDSYVNGIDLVVQTNLIMTDQYDAAADLNNDNVVNGIDYVMMVNLIMSFTAAPAIKDPASNRTASTAYLSIEDFDIKAGETKGMFINLSNPNAELTLLQFDMRLPEGLSIVIDEGDYAIDIAGRTTWKRHSLMAKDTNGVTRFLLASNTNALIDGDNGNVISIKLTASDDFTGGDIKLENQLLVSPDAEDMMPADYIFAVGDATSIEGIMAGQPADVYTLSGSKVRHAETLNGLPKGVYIIKGIKVIVK